MSPRVIPTDAYRLGNPWRDALRHRLNVSAHLLVCALLGTVTCASGTTRRALLVGIDEYEIAAPANPARGLSNLEGAANDVKAVHSLLLSRFGFVPKNTRTLINAEATRVAILSELRHHLVDPSHPGDVCVFYYSGHGSQIVNSKSPENDGKDETLVPVDAAQGEPDIRDKELQRIFNDILDKGASLTLFFDSCYSTSLQRGLINNVRFRSVKMDPRDVADPYGDPRGLPEDRGALVFSACQEFERAAEMQLDGVEHGVFSYALTKQLRNTQPNEPAEYVFASMKAQMNRVAPWQQPILKGTAERKSTALFGETKSQDLRRTIAALRSVDALGTCELEAGRAIGVHPGCELVRLDRNGTVGEGAVRIRVESLQGLTLCRAKVYEGDASRLQSGDLFAVERWAVPDESCLRLWIPDRVPRFEELERLLEDLSDLRTMPSVHWIVDPTNETPSHRMHWADSTWKVDFNEEEHDLGNAPKMGSVRNYLAAYGSLFNPPSFFLQIPPPLELVRAMTLATSDPESPIKVTSYLDDAHYMLVGRVESGKLQYAWVRPNVTQEMAETSSVLPVRTSWLTYTREGVDADLCATQLQELAMRLTIINNWCALESPPDDDTFPYRLAFENVKTGEVDKRDQFFAEDKLRVSLHAEESDLERGVLSRYVYLFVLDSDGKSTLLFPADGDNATNLLPPKGTADSLPAVIPLQQFTVGKPFGVDTYVLLTSREPLPDPRVLERSGVRSRGAEPKDPLSKLLARISSGRRGDGIVTPMDWSIERRSVRAAAVSAQE